ncbi:chaperone protein [Streptomyces sp. L-9-10]|uniref:wHTH domain-containing protein n=1 Tax=Streptomyces sp. L-9-10 TaxID=1478131 RepID=UPI00101B7BD0|nr:caspase family protein [Streptomyces sp. L-9-10]RYJ30797.1 chaperone protein [Streptomyces sp. L-9-10]
MPRHKALLIGASEYDDETIRSLPFVRDDLQRLEGALSDRGFRPVEIAESQRGITPNAVNRHVLRFLREAGRGDTLFVMLSGHGVHFDGRDYLVPEDAYYESEPFAESCVEIGWQKELEDSPAGQVVFLIDACREGSARRTKAPTRMPGWERPKIAATLRRKVAYVYACSKAQYALYVDESEAVLPQHADAAGTQPKDSFSLFSRAVSDVVSAVPHTLHMGEFLDEVQRRVTALHTAYGKTQPVQRVRAETDIPWQEFTVLPGPARDAAEHPWVRGTATHPAWERTTPGVAREALKDVCATLAARLAEGYETAAATLRDDPWHDAELAKRAQDRLGFLTGRLAAGAELSPTEGALTVLLPLLGQAFWTHEAAQRAPVVTAGPADQPTPERDRFGKFAQGFPRLQRRLRTLEQRGVSDGSAERIRWWLFHRWLIRQPELYASQTLKTLLGPPPGGTRCPEWVTEALSGERFMRFLQELRAAPFAVPRHTPGRPGDQRDGDCDVIAASTRDEHEVRESLVASLAKAAQAFAVDAVDLPEILVEHIGISDSVDLGDLLTTIRGSDWRTSGLGRSLNAVCGHPAVQIALREHARRVDGLLRDINRTSALAPLRSLPPYADADRVRLGGNTPTHLADGIRFQLAEDRVQELLMGEELYGERELAIRELYQNALDAVRYRDRRTEYLRRTREADRTGEMPTRWDGLIEFVQKADAQGRPYLECRDNGVGMGLDELRDVFSQGGARFVDLPEYIEEQTAWAELGEPRIELHPNSRFGIGVLSYFMLADEIEVTTCRMARDGRPGNKYQVKIAGPGNLFRVDDLGPGTDSGTTVRLLLTDHKERVSCVDTLQRVLWLAPYRTTAEHGSRRHEWEPGQLSLSGPELSWMDDSEMFLRSGACYPSGISDVWWVDGTGQFLADGLFAETPQYGQVHGAKGPYGTVINLQGEYQPELSVDRRKIRSKDDDHVKAVLSEALPTLFSTALPLLTPDWLVEVSLSSIRFADEVAERARTSGVSWPMGDTERPFDALGFFRPDQTLLPLVTGDYPSARETHGPSFLRTIPAPVLRWRLLTLYRAGLGDPLTEAARISPPLPCARPSDHLLLTVGGLHITLDWARNYKGWLAGPDNAQRSFGSSRFVLDSGIYSIEVTAKWRDPEQLVTLDDIFQLVARTELTAGNVAERLASLGYQVVPPTGSEEVGRTDLPLLRPLGSVREGWLSPGGELSVAQLCFSAARAMRSTHEAADRLRELGFGIPAGYPNSDAWTSEDREVLRRLWGLHADPVPLDRAQEITYAQLISVARAAGATTLAVAELLENTGFTLPPRYAPEQTFEDDEWALLVYNGISLDVDREVPLPHVIGVAYRTAQTPEEVAVRLRALGFDVPELPAGPPPLSKQDVNFLYGRYESASSRAWPEPGRPMGLRAIAERATRSTLSMAETAAKLSGLGYSCAPDQSLLDRLQEQDHDALRWGTPAEGESATVSPVQLYAVAEHLGRPAEDVAQSLTDFGYDVAEIPDTWLQERKAEADLIDVLSRGEEPIVDIEYTVELSLPTLATVAMRLGLPFRTVALKATSLGMRHEAETWFAAG